MEISAVSIKGEAAPKVTMSHHQMSWLNQIILKGLEQQIKIDNEQREKAHQDATKAIYGQL